MAEEAQQQPALSIDPDPQSLDVLRNFPTIPYTTTNPSTLPNPPDGYRTVYYDGASYHFYVFSRGGWRSVQFNYTPSIQRNVQLVVFDFQEKCAGGDGRYYFHVDDVLAGRNLVYVHAKAITAGVTGTMDIQIFNVTDSVDMLSTKLTIDSTETGSDTAAIPAVINTAYDDVAQNDLLRIDVDAVQTTAAKGLIVTLGFQTP